ncbi:MAG: hypothetical protein Q7K13_04750 [Polynucleobacter sp.]|uniref:hypothetical protein n=1 Tax=Polynucleobacter sp. TaxID=2029855 RepID=UPI00271CB17A|nr:hypothetical protein [Polynucleobacter sp.]MDO8713772.1 hypothetical protein [Polynucleobacter sp.]
MKNGKNKIDLAEMERVLRERLAEISFDKNGLPRPETRVLMGIFATEPGTVGEKSTDAGAIYDLAESALCHSAEDREWLADAVLAGMMIGLMSKDVDPATSEGIAKAFAGIASQARTKASAESKAKVFKWCDENMNRFKSMDAAAQDIAGTFISQGFRTVRDWMTEWKKATPHR